MSSSNLCAVVHERVLRPVVTGRLPVCVVGVRVRIWVGLDVRGGFVTFGVAGHAFLALLLIDADIIDAHDCRQHGRDLVEIDGCETVGHAKVGNDGHGLLWNGSSTNVAIGSSGRGLHGPGLFITHVPGDEAIIASLVFECILLVLLAIVPVGVQVRQTRDSLLVGSTLVGVHHSDRIIVDLHLFCWMLEEPGGMACKNLP